MKIIILGICVVHKTCLTCMHATELGNMLISNNSYPDVKVTNVDAPGKSVGSLFCINTYSVFMQKEWRLCNRAVHS